MHFLVLEASLQWCTWLLFFMRIFSLGVCDSKDSYVVSIEFIWNFCFLSVYILWGLFLSFDNLRLFFKLFFLLYGIFKQVVFQSLTLSLATVILQVRLSSEVFILPAKFFSSVILVWSFLIFTLISSWFLCVVSAHSTVSLSSLNILHIFSLKSFLEKLYRWPVLFGSADQLSSFSEHHGVLHCFSLCSLQYVLCWGPLSRGYSHGLR